MVIRNFTNMQFMLFLIVGGFSALVNFLARIMLSNWMSYRWAVVVAYLVGMITAFILSKYFVFERSGRSAKYELSNFVVVNLLAVIQVWLISVFLAEYAFVKVGFMFYPEEVAHMIGLAIPVFSSFLGHKYLSFKPKVN